MTSTDAAFTRLILTVVVAVVAATSVFELAACSHLCHSLLTQLSACTKFMYSRTVTSCIKLALALLFAYQAGSVLCIRCQYGSMLCIRDQHGSIIMGQCCASGIIMV